MQPQENNLCFRKHFCSSGKIKYISGNNAVASERIIQLSGSIILDPDRILVDPESSFVASAKLL